MRGKKFNVKILSLADIPKCGFNTFQYRMCNWIYCREDFHGWNRYNKKWLFAHKGHDRENIISFFSRIEKKLGIIPKTVFCATQRKWVTVIIMSSWWRKSLRRSLFTALLRASLKYDRKKRNFDAALYSVSYLKNTKYAISRFMRGYANFHLKWGFEQWYSAFYGLDEEEVDEILVK